MLIKLENAWVKAIAQHDVSALDRILADEFVDTSWTGALRDKQQMLARARSRRGGSGAQRLQDVRVRFYHGAAIVTGTNVVTNKRFGEVRVRFTDVFVMRDHRWQAVSAQETVVRASSARRK
ncbi:MAG TPA: nuclear transport factor 2 family protein [Gammaproteobacteria bacterium]|nr:nuclear transport factor 2 family protein [Gammaproteobacteria bacterium]